MIAIFVITLGDIVGLVFFALMLVVGGCWGLIHAYDKWQQRRRGKK